MSKQRRGKYIKTIPNWRGTCPICGRKRVKLVCIKKDEKGNILNICKRCISN